MKPQVVAVPHPDVFRPSGQSPVLRRWLYYEDLQFPEAHPGFQFEPKSIRGGVIDDGWVIFHGLQVLCIVPEEVHTYWHHEAQASEAETGNIWLVRGSQWLASFAPSHLGRCSHYVMECHDQVIEVICEDLLFGVGSFERTKAIEQEPRLGDAYYWRAIQREKEGRIEEALADYEAVVRKGQTVVFSEDAKAHIRLLRGQKR
jgi:hypothetical protein